MHTSLEKVDDAILPRHPPSHYTPYNAWYYMLIELEENVVIHRPQ